jgi:hypothetical protein
LIEVTQCHAFIITLLSLVLVPPRPRSQLKLDLSMASSTRLTTPPLSPGKCIETLLHSTLLTVDSGRDAQEADANLRGRSTPQPVRDKDRFLCLSITHEDCMRHLAGFSGISAHCQCFSSKLSHSFNIRQQYLACSGPPAFAAALYTSFCSELHKHRYTDAKACRSLGSIPRNVF